MSARVAGPGLGTGRPAASAAVMVGKPRRLGDKQRAWRVRAYQAPRPCVRLKDPESGYAWTTWYPDDHQGETLASLFADTEEFLDQVEANIARPTISWAAARWLDAVRDPSPQTDTFANRENLVKVWIDSPIDEQAPLGATPVDQWTAALSGDFFDRVAATGRIGGRRTQDLRTVLAAIRDHAHAQGWLASQIDPLRRLRLASSKTITHQSSQAGYTEERVRPRTEAVERLIGIAEERWRPGERVLNPHQLRIGCYLGPRLSEQLGLAVEDVDLGSMRISVRGVWVDPRGTPAHWRPWTKNRKQRTLGYLGSWRDGIVALVADALGLPDGAAPQRVADEAARLRREFDLWYDAYVLWHNDTRRNPTPPPMPARRYLFPDPRTGLPWTQEAFNERFRALRAATVGQSLQGAGAAWPTHIPYRNARHHAATWLHAHLPSAGDADWTVVARLLGNTPETCRRYYVLAAEGAVEGARRELAGM